MRSPAQGSRGEPQVLQQHLVHLKHISIRRRDTDETIHLMAVQRRRIVDGAQDAVAKFIYPIRENSDPTLAGRPIASWKVVQDLRKSVLLQLLTQRRLFEIVGKQIFHAAEPGSLGRGKAFQERQFSEKHCQIGGKFRHDLISSGCPAGVLINPD